MECKMDTKSTLRLCIFSWNVNGINPPDAFEHLSRNGSEIDMFVIGLQEVQNSVQSLFLENRTVVDGWLEALANGLPNGLPYTLIAVENAVGLLVAVFVRSDLRHHISGVSHSWLGVGPLGSCNKGAVAVRLQLGGQSLCFVAAHLTAHSHNVLRRNADFHTIAANLVFPNALGIYDDKHDAVFFFGDLNYRVTCTYEMALDKIKNNCQTDLLAYDQLLEAHKRKAVLVGFSEPRITFWPTFKVDIGSVDSYDTGPKRRVPSWTDRIFYKGRAVKVSDYGTCMDVTPSDHKPIHCIADFELAKPLDITLTRANWETVRRQMGILTPFGTNVILVATAIVFVITRLLPVVLTWLKSIHGALHQRP